MPPTTVRHPRPVRTRRVPETEIVCHNVEPTEEQIRRRAYEIFLQRNGAPGSPEADWLQAEAELRGRLALLGRV